MKRFAQLFGTFVKDEAGLETVEYAVMAGLILVATVTAISTLGGKITAAFNTLAGYM